ncbi:hypothetical protein [Nocardia testacea]|uniref:hypothetical protein n=1 Tax=Nocardia testacea TaxID=248551 RepID=UPI003A8A2399
MPQRHTQPLSRNPALRALRGTAGARDHAVEVDSRSLPGERLTVHRGRSGAPPRVRPGLGRIGTLLDDPD